VKILTPGPGVGGHCISVDPWFLVHASPERTPLIRTARHVNDFKPHFVIERTLNAARQIEQPVIGCLGLTYKADVDDIRESPSLEIARELALSGAGEVLVCDPYVTPAGFSDAPLVTLDEVLDRCQILVLLTDHAEFRSLTAEQLADKCLIDTRGTWRHTLAAATATVPRQQRRAA
jgi:UDP-N-acetyl-D-mannosaminuronic acid dehydrogenase